MRASLLCIALVACGPNIRGNRFVTLPPNEAAHLSARYHDRVMVVAIDAPNEEPRDIRAVVVSDGAFVITSSNEKLPTRHGEQLKLRIDYLDGDPALLGGVVHKGPSKWRLGAGGLLSALGSVGLGSIAVATDHCGEWNAGIVGGKANCELGMAALGGAAVTMTIAGIILLVRGGMSDIRISPR